MKTDKVCQWEGCHYNGDTVLEGRLLCRDHFHQDAVRKLERYRSRLRSANESDTERASLSKFVSEIISQTTVLVSRTKLLSQEQRNLFLELSRISLQFYKRVQRNPRQLKRLPILVSSLEGEPFRQAEAETTNISVNGACFESSIAWRIGEPVTIRRVDTNETATARIARVDSSSGR